MTKEEYGARFKDHLLEQYKLYVEMTDNVSSRRAQANMFYISVLSGLLAVLSIVARGSSLSDAQGIAFLAAAMLGTIICYVWYVNIRSYRQLNSGKFKVIHAMEQQLPFPCYDREWEIIGEGKESKEYLPLTRVEQYVPAILAIPYLTLIIYSLCVMIR